MAKFSPLPEVIVRHWQSLSGADRRRWLIAITHYWVDRIYKDDPPLVLTEILTV